MWLKGLIVSNKGHAYYSKIPEVLGTLCLQLWTKTYSFLFVPPHPTYESTLRAIAPQREILKGTSPHHDGMYKTARTGL
jgi:hypothetical protein